MHVEEVGRYRGVRYGRTVIGKISAPTFIGMHVAAARRQGGAQSRFGWS